MRSLATALVVLAAAVGVAACSGGERQSGGRHRLDLKVGDLVPLSGIQQALGVTGQKSVNIAAAQIRKAIDEVNAKHTLTISNQNYRSESQLAQESASKLQRAGYSCFVGPWSAGDVSQVSDNVAVLKKVLEITPAASSDALRTLQVDKDGSINPYLTRTIAVDSLQGPALTQVIADSLGGSAKGKKVSVATYRSIYGESLTKSFVQAWQKLGGKISARVEYDPNLPSYRKQARELVAPKPDAFVFFDFSETYTKLATELLKTHKWSPAKSFGGDSLAISTLGQGGGALVEGLRGVAPGAPRTGPAAAGFRRLYAAGGPPGYTQPFNAQAFDATMLCYLSAVAAGSTKGSRMAHEVRQISGPPGEKFTWLQLPEAIRALEAGKDIDYEGASGPIDMDKVGNPTAGYYDVYKFQNARLATYGVVSVPATGKGIQKYPLHYITPKIPGSTPVAAGPSGASGATGPTGASGAAGVKPAKPQKAPTKKKK